MSSTSAGSLTAVSELMTPFALIDGRRLQANIAGMQERIAGIGADMRPHFKTHRTLTIAELQLGAGAIGLTVATGAQLGTVKREFDCPVLISSLLQADTSIAGELREACAAGGVMFAVEGERSLALLRTALGPDLVPELMIEVETGCRRTGVEPEECAALARLAIQLGCRVVGVFSYPGHGYIPGQSAAASEDEQRSLAAAAAELARAGLDPEHVSAGSTPTIRHAKPGVVTEYRPGTYIFGDRQQLTLGAVERSQLALTIVATVSAVHGERIVLDAGGKALGRDAPRWLEGFGELLESPGTKITRLYDHHAVVDSYHGPSVRVGDRVAIVPNNANSVMALLRSAWLSVDGELAEELNPQADR
jgi:D-serine deaminase-like pyridoxal phosphate-dependent protein